MKTVCYYPGCSLKSSARRFELSARKVSQKLGIDLQEMDRWNCCGTVYSLTKDNLMKQLAPVRNLIRAQDSGHKRLYTLCSMCDNTLKRANALVKQDEEKLEKINAFMDQEEDYNCEVKVVHFLELLRDELGWEKLSQTVVSPLKGINVAPYYGCTLTRPKELGLDDPYRPTVLSSLIETLGAVPVNFPHDSECCGSFQTVDEIDLVLDKCHALTQSALEAGADLIVTSCPLCQFNLDERQARLSQITVNHKPIPVIYFTQLIGLAFGVCGKESFSENEINPGEALALTDWKPSRC